MGGRENVREWRQRQNTINNQSKATLQLTVHIRVRWVIIQYETSLHTASITHWRTKTKDK